MKNKILIFFSTIIIIAVLLLVFIANNFYIEFNMSKGDIILEYNQKYELNEPKAALIGKYLFKEGYEIPVNVSNNIDTTKLGEYQITYKSKYIFWENEISTKVIVKDTTPPTITLKHIDDYYTLPNEEYIEEGYWAYDNFDEDLTDEVVISTEKGQVKYEVKDSSGNVTTEIRDIFYDDPIPPKLTLKGDKTITIEEGTPYEEIGYTAIDNCDGDITQSVVVTGKVDYNTIGSYEITYSIKDYYNNETKAVRTIIVTTKPTPIPTPEPTNTPTPTPSPTPISTETPQNPNNTIDKVIYLTFDDGPSKYTPQLLEVLKKYNIKATFFVVDTGYDYLIKDIYNDGHAIGIHTLTHDYKNIYCSEEAFFKDLYAMQDLIFEHTGIRPTLTRFPGGSSNTVSKKYCKGIMTTLSKSLPEKGFQYFDWNVSSGDAGGTTDKNQVIKNVINGCKNKKISVVLQHDTKKYSVNAVEEIIIWGLENGYTFLPLDMNSPGMHHGINN